MIVVPLDVKTESALAFFIRPELAVTCPNPVNCVNVRLVVLTVIGSLVIKTQPVSAFAVPSATKDASPVVTSASTSASVALTILQGRVPAAPDAVT